MFILVDKLIEFLGPAHMSMVVSGTNLLEIPTIQTAYVRTMYVRTMQGDTPQNITLDGTVALFQGPEMSTAYVF